MTDSELTDGIKVEIASFLRMREFANSIFRSNNTEEKQEAAWRLSNAMDVALQAFCEIVGVDYEIGGDDND